MGKGFKGLFDEEIGDIQQTTEKIQTEESEETKTIETVKSKPNNQTKKKKEKVDETEVSLKFGIRFWGFVARNLQIKGSGSLTLNELKREIAEKLLEQIETKA